MAKWPELIFSTRARGATRKTVSVFAGSEFGWVQLDQNCKGKSAWNYGSSSGVPCDIPNCWWKQRRTPALANAVPYESHALPHLKPLPQAGGTFSKDCAAHMRLIAFSILMLPWMSGCRCSHRRKFPSFITHGFGGTAGNVQATSFCAGSITRSVRVAVVM